MDLTTSDTAFTRAKAGLLALLHLATCRIFPPRSTRTDRTSLPLSHHRRRHHHVHPLEHAGAGDPGVALGGAGAGADGLDGADDLVRSLVAADDLAEDDVLAVEPGGHDGGDEELRAVAA